MSSCLKNYNDTLGYLYGLQKYGIKLGLANIKKLMQILGEPHRGFHAIHIAGTNGKGSTATIVASILNESGFRVGLYTSPHLVSFTERIRINGQPITESDVIGLTSYIHEKISRTSIKPTFFEFVTAMAFHYFRHKRVDWAVIETGMGGRFDATNVILPEISVITNVSIEHEEFLGKSISEITYEKAGIIKPNTPVITGTKIPKVVEQLIGIAKNRSADIHIYGRDFNGSLLSMDERSITFDYHGYRSYHNLLLPLPGKHQLYNSSLAIRACEILKQKGVPIHESAIVRGLSKVNIEGRLEWVSRTPPIIIDSAHNPEAANTLAESIKELFYEKKIILIIGIMKDKDLRGILRPLIRLADLIILTSPRGERAARPEELRDCVREIQKEDTDYSSISVELVDTVPKAIALAKKLWQNNSVIFATGSFYTTGEVKEALGKKGVLSGLRE